MNSANASPTAAVDEQVAIDAGDWIVRLLISIIGVDTELTPARVGDADHLGMFPSEAGRSSLPT